MPRLVSGEFDPENQKAVWPSTGNYCRGGAFDSALLGCTSIAILPEGMRKERFEWLAQDRRGDHRHAGLRVEREGNLRQVLGTRRRTRCTSIFNQFEEFGNPIWHYNVTGPAMEEVFRGLATTRTRLAGCVAPPAPPAPSPPAIT